TRRQLQCQRLALAGVLDPRRQGEQLAGLEVAAERQLGGAFRGYRGRDADAVGERELAPGTRRDRPRVPVDGGVGVALGLHYLPVPADFAGPVRRERYPGGRLELVAQAEVEVACEAGVAQVRVFQDHGVVRHLLALQLDAVEDLVLVRPGRGEQAAVVGA